MKILHINTHDRRDGAGRAAYRLHKGLLQKGFDSSMFLKSKVWDGPSLFAVRSDEAGEKSGDRFLLDEVIQQYFIRWNRTEVSNTLFSIPYPGYDISELEITRTADIVHLHWVAGFQSPRTLKKLASLGKPIVWTLHDQRPFTGGCHYSAGCDRYRERCSNCPQLSEDLCDLAEAVLKDEEEAFKGTDLIVVSPSRWLASCAKQSKIFQNARIEVIPNSLETDLFRPLPKVDAKKGIGVSEETLVILFGALEVSEKRKGFHELIRCLDFCMENEPFMALVREKKIRMLCFGRESDELEKVRVPLFSLGHLDDDEGITRAYCAADLFLLPSLEDNLPNTVLESMSCGTPVIAFDVGGVPDMVKSGVTGHVVPAGDAQGMAQAIMALLFDAGKREFMGRNCRDAILKGHSMDVQAQRVARLYQDLLGEGDERQNESDGCRGREGKEGTPDTGLFDAPLDCEMGPYFREIYDSLLFKALKAYAPYIYKKWEASENDRAARLKVIQAQQKVLDHPLIRCTRGIGSLFRR